MGIGLTLKDISQPAVETDRHLKISGLNQAALDFFEYEPKDILGKPLFNRFLIPHDGKPAPKIQDGLQSRFLQAVPQSGMPSYFLVTCIPLDGNRRVLFLMLDVTGEFRHQRELASQQSINLVVSSITNRLLDVSYKDLRQNVEEISRTLSMFLAAEACYVCRVRPKGKHGASPAGSRLVEGRKYRN